MNLKNTKGTPPKNTNNALSTGGPPAFIANTSPVSDNIGENVSASSKWGRICEELVAQKFLKLGFKILFRRFKSPFAEIDLVCRKADEIILLEVKSLSDADWVLQRISQRQRQRLKNALKYFQNHFCDEVRLHLAFVSSDGEIEIFEDFLA